MRKKSHISLAAYLVRELRLEELDYHKKAFYFGSVLPDLNPKMVKEPHEFETSYEKMKEYIDGLIEDGKKEGFSNRVFWRKAGVVAHYLADYFTFPHNATYGGSLKDHCLYEGDMKHRLREFVFTPEAKMIFRNQKPDIPYLNNTEELFAYIEGAHQRYLSRPHTVLDDCKWILEVCSFVLMSILVMAEKEEAVQRFGRLCAAA